MRDTRIKNYDFNNAGSLTASVAGNISAQYTQHVINGVIQKVVIGSNSWTGTGSIYIRESGNPNETLCVRRGVAQGVVYPVIVPTVAGTGVASTISEIQPITNDILVLTASGLGNGTSGLSISIFYI